MILAKLLSESPRSFKMWSGVEKKRKKRKDKEKNTKHRRRYYFSYTIIQKTGEDWEVYTRKTRKGQGKQILSNDIKTGEDNDLKNTKCGLLLLIIERKKKGRNKDEGFIETLNRARKLEDKETYKRKSRLDLIDTHKVV